MLSLKLALFVSHIAILTVSAQNNGPGRFFSYFRSELEKKCPTNEKSVLQVFNCAYSSREDFNKFQNEISAKLCKKPSGNDLEKCKDYVRDEVERFAYTHILELDTQRIKEKQHRFNINDVKEICNSKNIIKPPLTPNSDIECAKFISEIEIDTATVEYCNKNLVCLFNYADKFVSLNFFGSKSKKSIACQLEKQLGPDSPKCYFGENEYDKNAFIISRNKLSGDLDLSTLYRNKKIKESEISKQNILCKNNAKSEEQLICPKGIYVLIKDSKEEADDLLVNRKAKTLPTANPAQPLGNHAEKK